MVVVLSERSKFVPILNCPSVEMVCVNRDKITHVSIERIEDLYFICGYLDLMDDNKSITLCVCDTHSQAVKYVRKYFYDQP